MRLPSAMPLENRRDSMTSRRQIRENDDAWAKNEQECATRSAKGGSGAVASGHAECRRPSHPRRLQWIAASVRNRMRAVAAPRRRTIARCARRASRPEEAIGDDGSVPLPPQDGDPTKAQTSSTAARASITIRSASSGASASSSSPHARACATASRNDARSANASWSSLSPMATCECARSPASFSTTRAACMMAW